MFVDVADKATQGSDKTAPSHRAMHETGSDFPRDAAKTLRGEIFSDAYKVKRGLRLNRANNPKKVKGPTEVALSAIQEALNISDLPATDSRGSVRSDVTPPTSPSAYPED